MIRRNSGRIKLDVWPTVAAVRIGQPRPERQGVYTWKMLTSAQGTASLGCGRR